MRAKQLAISQAEREARRKLIADEKEAKRLAEEQLRKRQGLEANKKSEAYRKQLAELQGAIGAPRIDPNPA